MPKIVFENIYKENFPFWEKISDADREYICQNSHMLIYPKGRNIHNGEECSGVIFVRSGSLRLYMMSGEGKEITLYRLHRGDLCMLSASCLLDAVFDYSQCGDAHNMEFLCQFRFLVYVDFAYQVLRVFRRNLFHYGGYHAAGTAPVGVEIQEHGLFAGSYRIKVVFVYMDYGHDQYLPFFLFVSSVSYPAYCFCDEVTFFALHISCVIVPMGQYTHQERGLNKVMVKNPSTVEVSITL